MTINPAALAIVDRFIANHAGLTREGIVQPGQGHTNHVVFVRRGAETIVFKVFCEPERKQRECFALRHWRNTGMVPELIWDVDAITIAISHVPGHYFAGTREIEGDVAWSESCRDLGRAVGRLIGVPLTSADRAVFEGRFYGELGSLETYLGRILKLGRSIHTRDADFGDAFWGRSLDFIESHLDAIFAQPRILYHQDVSNLHVQHGRFQGFFDLEMCRVGCAAMQLGAIGAMGANPAAWALFCEGWLAARASPLTQGDLDAAMAASQLLGWREISRYLSYDGTPGTGYAWASPADPSRYRKRRDRNNFRISRLPGR